jgi:hypothetical protein
VTLAEAFPISQRKKRNNSCSLAVKTLNQELTDTVFGGADTGSTHV